ncbi:MAG: methyl-accepting chemotaxis protein, partial [Phycisphaeraceae bacterium]
MKTLLDWLMSRGLGTRVLAITLVIVACVVTINNVIFIGEHREAANDAMVDKASAFTALANRTNDHVGMLQADDTFDNETLLAELKRERQSATERGEKYDYTQARIFNTLPVVAGWRAAEKAAADEGINFQISSFDARNPDNEPDAKEGDEDFDRRGAFAANLLTDLEAQVGSGGEETIARVDQATNTLHYMRAIKLTQDCMLCHGDPATSPTGDGKDVLGFTMEDWSVGDMHGAYHVMMPLSTVDADVQEATTSVLLFVVPMVVGAAVLFALILRRMFNAPINALIGRIKDIAQGEGDLTQRVEVKSKDEIGQLGTWFNAFVTKVHDVIAEVKLTSNEVAAASTQIAASSEQIAAGANEQSAQITQVSSAVEEMSASVVEVARK